MDELLDFFEAETDVSQMRKKGKLDSLTGLVITVFFVVDKSRSKDAEAVVENKRS